MPRARAATTAHRGLDRDAMHELELFVDNDGDLYEKMVRPIEKNLYLKIVKGTYLKGAAEVAWGHLLEVGAKKYAKEIGGGAWNAIFPKAERDALAAEYARHFERRVSNDEYRHLDKTLPKKYRPMARVNTVALRVWGAK